MVSLAELQSVKLIEWSKTATSKPERRKFIKSSWISEFVKQHRKKTNRNQRILWFGNSFLITVIFFLKSSIHSSRQTRLETHHSVFIIVGQVFDEEYQFNSILLCESERFTRERDECTPCKRICGTECFTAAGRAAKRKINRSTERQTVKVRQQEWTDARTNTHIPQWSTHQKQNPCHMQVWILLEIDTCMNLYGARCMAVFARRALGNKK